MNFSDLAARFPRSEVHWRAQKLTNKGDKALALAYLDARDVMRRLDEVCGPDGWKDGYVETPSGRIICTLCVSVNERWIGKSDGAGDTDFEGAKGAMSDAFKRAAVKWGIGRYLYDLGATYVPCETWTGTDGKPRWSKWTVDPWTCVRNAPAPVPEPEQKPQGPSQAMIDKALATINQITNLDELSSYWKALNEEQRAMAYNTDVIAAKDQVKAELTHSLDKDSIPY